MTLEQLSYEALERRLAREKQARLAAEGLLEKKSLELFQANQDVAAQAELIGRERAVLGAVFDARPAALVLTNSALEVERLNPVARGLFALPDGAAPGQSLPDLLSGTAGFLDWVRARAGAQPEIDDSTVEGFARQASGEEIPVRISCSLIGYNDLRLWIILDIRRHLAAEEEKKVLERSLVQAQKMEALGTLASGVAHEINTPIQYIGDNVSFLQEVCGAVSAFLGAVDGALAAEGEPVSREQLAATLAGKRAELDIDYLLEETPSAIAQSLHGLKQVASIVSAIREFSHPGDTEMTPVDLNAVIDTTLSVTRNSWKNIAEVEHELDPDLPGVLGHAGDLHQLILNLIGNATDAIAERAPSGGGKIRISTGLERNNVVIRVQDNGTGIKDADRTRVFDPFFTTKAPGKGTGQGLAIVFKIVNVGHGGQISVDSTWGEGTTFTIRLPRSEG